MNYFLYGLPNNSSPFPLFQSEMDVDTSRCFYYIPIRTYTAGLDIKDCMKNAFLCVCVEVFPVKTGSFFSLSSFRSSLAF